MARLLYGIMFAYWVVVLIMSCVVLAIIIAQQL